MDFAEDDLTEDGFLGGRVRLLQPKTGYRAATDPVLLAAAVPASAGQAVLEPGVGTGAALCCLAARVPGLSLTGLEQQSDYAGLARRNAALNGVAATILEGDVASPPPELAALRFDHVMINPPFHGAAAATGATDPGRDRAHREGLAGLAEFLALGLRRLAPKGTLTVIHRAERLDAILAALSGRAGDIRVLPLAPRVGRPAKRVIVRARKGSAAPLLLLPPFVIHAGAAHAADGADFTPAAEAVLRDAAPLPMAAER